MEPPLCSLFLLGALALTGAGAGSHSLRYFYTGWSRPELGRPGFVIVGYVDEQEFVRFDADAESPRLEPRVEWIRRVGEEDPEYWEQQTRIGKDEAQVFGVDLETLRGYYNQSRGGDHAIQLMYGCEVSPDGRLLRGYRQYAYDGRDYISLDTETVTWVAAQTQAENTKRKWEGGSVAEREKAYLEETCVEWVQKYLRMVREAPTRTDPPSARVTRHTTPHGEVTLRCRAQDFYPSQITLTWLKDGEEQLQETEFIETRPGGDGTFQKWAAVGVPQDQEGSYTCQVKHQGLAEPLNLKWEPPSSSTWTLLGVIVGVLLLLTAVTAGVVIWKKNSGAKGRAYAPAAGHDSDQGSDPSLSPKA